MFPRYFVSILLGTFLGAAAASGATIFTVGLDPACDFSTITAAYEAIETSETRVEIRIAKTYEGQGASRVRIEDLGSRPPGFVLYLYGGFETCDDEGPRQGLRTVLVGGDNGGHPLVTIADGGSPALGVSIYLRDLELRNHDLSAVGRDGAGLHITAGDVVLAGNVLLAGLKARNGGAIYLSAVPTAGDRPQLRIYFDVEMLGNASLANEPGATGGGGIRCLGTAEKRPRIDGELVGTFHGHDAINEHPDGTSFGGFARLSQCDAELWGRPAFTQGSADNGGLFSVAGSGGSTLRVKLHLSVSPQRLDRNRLPLALSHAGSGGALFVNGPSSVRLEGVSFESNKAEVGGAVAAFGSSTVRIRPNRSGFNSFGWSSLFGNTATEAGGALAISSGARLEVEGAIFYENDAPNGAAVHIGPTAAPASIRDSLFFDNDREPSTGEVLHLAGPELRLDHLTTAGHNLPQVLRAEPGSRLVVERSLFADPTVTRLFDGGGDLELGDCVLSSATADPELEPLERLASAEEARLLDQAGRDFRLAPTSPAIDRCRGQQLEAQDLDGEVRGSAAPGGELGRSVDSGADEYQERLELCGEPGILLGGEETILALPPFAVPVSDIDLELELSNPATTSTRYEVEMRGVGAPSFSLVGAMGARSTRIFDQEAWPGQPSRTRPMILPNPDAPEGWELRLTHLGEGPPSVLERWCLSGDPSFPRTPEIFADDFEDGDLEAWSAVVSP